MAIFCTIVQTVAMVSRRKAKKATARFKERWKRVSPPQPKPVKDGFVVPCQELLLSEAERTFQQIANSPELKSHERRVHPFLLWLKGLGASSVLLGGLGIMQPQFFWLAVGLVYAGLLLFFVDLYFETFSRAWRATAGLAIVVSLVWFSVGIVFVSARLDLLTLGSQIDYSIGNAPSPGGIVWRSFFTELDVTMANPTDENYDNVDMLVRPDYPVAAIAQLSNLPDVSFENRDGVDARITAEEVDGNKPPVTLVFLATNAGYKVHCGRIPPHSSLTIVTAVVEVKKATQTVKPGTPITIPNINALSLDDFSTEITMSGKDGTFGYWFGSPKNISLYLPKPKPQNVLVNGYYTASNRRRGLTKNVSVWWRQNE